MVCAGESFTLPEAWDVPESVRVALPAVAVIVTAVAFVVCQLRVTLCPALIELALAEKMRVGAALGAVLGPARLLQAVSPHKANGIIPLVMQRTLFLLILLYAGFPGLHSPEIRCHPAMQQLV
ncbi:MAG TPA: hypothetical protein VFO46_01085 [Candidatus Sulfotelmatobacter sp.]|nr:hypothetical protein [Candidatus Sulfotelmatobacter sp.]